MTKNKTKALVPFERIAQSILILRGRRVLLDSDLAALYGAAAVALNTTARGRHVYRHDF